MFSFCRNSTRSICWTALFEREREAERKPMRALLETRPREKKKWTYTRRAACRKTSGTKLSTPDKKAHARKTHSPARDKRRARNKTAMRRARIPAPLSLWPLCLSSTFRKQKTREKPSEKMNYFPRKTRARSMLGERKGRRAKGSDETKSRQETDSSKLIGHLR